MKSILDLQPKLNAKKRWRALIAYRSQRPSGYFVEVFFDEFDDLGEAIESGPNYTCIISIQIVPNGLWSMSNLTVEEASHQ